MQKGMIPTNTIINNLRLSGGMISPANLGHYPKGGFMKKMLIFSLFISTSCLASSDYTSYYNNIIQKAYLVQRQQTAIQAARFNKSSDITLCHRIGNAAAEARHLEDVADIDYSIGIYNLITQVGENSKKLIGYCDDQWENDNVIGITPGDKESLKLLNIMLLSKTESLINLAKEKLGM